MLLCPCVIFLLNLNPLSKVAHKLQLFLLIPYPSTEFPSHLFLLAKLAPWCKQPAPPNSKSLCQGSVTSHVRNGLSNTTLIELRSLQWQRLLFQHLRNCWPPGILVWSKKKRKSGAKQKGQGQVAKIVQANRRATSVQHIPAVICRMSDAAVAPTHQIMEKKHGQTIVSLDFHSDANRAEDFFSPALCQKTQLAETAEECLSHKLGPSIMSFIWMPASSEALLLNANLFPIATSGRDCWSFCNPKMFTVTLLWAPGAML